MEKALIKVETEIPCKHWWNTQRYTTTYEEVEVLGESIGKFPVGYGNYIEGTKYLIKEFDGTLTTVWNTSLFFKN